MRLSRARWILALAMTNALLLSACASLFSPRPPPEPETFDLSERRAMNHSLVADPDPAPLSSWQFGAPDAGAPARPAPR